MADVFFRPDGQNRFQIRSAANGTLPSAWLDQEFNSVYTALNSIENGGTTIGTEWATVSGEYNYISENSFSVVGDFSSIFETGRAIRFTDEDNVSTLSHIRTATYVGGTNTTTVTVYDSVVPTTIEGISVGLISSSAASLPRVAYTTRSSSYLVSDKDQIIFADDTNTSSLSLVYDDNQVNGEGYYALRITLPDASYLPGKLLCIKKIAGNHVTIVSSAFTHTTQTDGTDVTHINTYNFQIYGDASAKNRVTLSGVGDCYWLVSNGSRWYELTPEASENVKGIVKLATDEEMALSAEQIAAGDELSRTLAVSPYQLDKNFVRTDASNLRFASNFIYKAPNGVANLVNNNIIVASGLGLNIPDGKDAAGVIQTKKLELESSITYAPVEVTEKVKLMFITSQKSVLPILANNFYMQYGTPTVRNTVMGDSILWFDFGTNLLKLSTDNGTNWTTFDGAGPICSYSGNGTYTTNIQSFGAMGVLTREDMREILLQAQRDTRIQWARGWTITSGTTLDRPCFVQVEGNVGRFAGTFLRIGGKTVWAGGATDGTLFCGGSGYGHAGDVVTFGNQVTCTVFPLEGAIL